MLRPLLLCLAVVWSSTQPVHAAAAAPSIAIIGAGIGGAAAAHYLGALLPDSGINITVFERSPAAGGRTKELRYGAGDPGDDEPGGQQQQLLELGASIIHASNQRVVELAAAVNLTLVEPRGAGAGAMGVFDGAGFVVQQVGLGLGCGVGWLGFGCGFGVVWVWCGVVGWGVVWCGVVWVWCGCGVVWCGMVGAWVWLGFGFESHRWRGAASCPATHTQKSPPTQLNATTDQPAGSRSAAAAAALRSGACQVGGWGGWVVGMVGWLGGGADNWILCPACSSNIRTRL